MTADAHHLRLAIRLARRGLGTASPNPMVGAVLVKRGRIIGRGWHRQVGGPHAEIEALQDAAKQGHRPRGATLYVTLEPCCTHGRTPPCTDSIIAAGIRRVVVGATDPNPRHRGRAFTILKHAGVTVSHGLLAGECARLNEAFNHWIVNGTPLVTVKAAMTLDGKIATASGESKWITGGAARRRGMKLRQGADAILVGINTVLADDPSLTVRIAHRSRGPMISSRSPTVTARQPRRIVLDGQARTPLDAQVVTDGHSALTSVVVSRAAPKRRVAALARRVRVLVAPVRKGRIDLRWLLKRLGSEGVTQLLVEGGGEVNASFLLSGLAHRVAFFYAPKVLGGRDSRHAVAGLGARRLDETLDLVEIQWRRLGADLFLTAWLAGPS